MRLVQSSLEYLGRLWAAVHVLLRRHWQRALQVREKLRFNEETFHLVLAGGVGVIGGLVTLGFYYCVELTQWFFVRQSGDLVTVAENLGDWQRLLIPTVGGLVAGMVLYWGLRLVGNQGSSNIMEVVATSDGRLP